MQGEKGIGKSTFVKKLALDWAKVVEGRNVVNEEMAAPSKCGGGEKTSREDSARPRVAKQENRMIAVTVVLTP